MVKEKTIFKIVFLSSCLVSFCIPYSSKAAMLLIDPSSGTYKVGDTITASIKVSSYAQSMNAVSGTLSYPKDELTFVSVSKNDSLIQQWLPPGATGPIVSKTSGTISFQGILIGGYQGPPKTVFSVSFKVKKSGTAKFTFTNGTVLANDGKGTDLTQSLKSASYKLASAPAPVVVGKIAKKKTPLAKTDIPPEVPVTAPVNVSVVDVTPVVVPSPVQNPVVVSAPPVLDYYKVAIISGFGILIILVLMLFVRIARLTRMVRGLQVRKKATVRRKTAGFSAQKVSTRSKSNNPLIFRGAVNK